VAHLTRERIFRDNRHRTVHRSIGPFCIHLVFAGAQTRARGNSRHLRRQFSQMLVSMRRNARASVRSLLLPGGAFILGGETAKDSLCSRAAANESGFSERACRPATRSFCNTIGKRSVELWRGCFSRALLIHPCSQPR